MNGPGRLLIVGLMVWVVGCGGQPPREKYPIRIVATTGMVADLVKHVGGKYVAVTTLMGEGVDPHLFKPAPDDSDKLSEADLIFFSGRNLEGKMGELFRRMKQPTCGIADAIDDQFLLDGEGGHHDPHLWFDVALWSRTLDPIRDLLVKHDPDHAEEYRDNTEAYRKKLLDLHKEVEAEIATIPASQRVLVTAHDAFRYFGKAYGMEVRGIQGISTESEAGLRSFNRLVDFLKERRIKAVFVESSVSPKNVEALVEGCGAPPNAHKLTIGGELFSDAMGEAGTPKGTYPGMVRHNVRTIVEALK